MLSQRYLILSFVFAAAILVLAAIMPLHTARTVRSMQQEVQRAEERGALLTEVLSLIQDAETGQRGYLLTHDETYLAPYEQAKVRLPSVFEQAEGTLGGEPEQVGQFQLQPGQVIEGRALEWIDHKIEVAPVRVVAAGG